MSLSNLQPRREIVSAREGGVVSLPARLDTPQIRDRLLRVAGRQGVGVLTYDGRHLRAQPVVGVLDAGPVQLQLLPKVSPTSSATDDLRYMTDLLRCTVLRPRLAQHRGRVAVPRGDLLEVVIRAFAEDLLARLALGVPRRYAMVEETTPVVRGRVNITGLARRLPGSEHLMPIRHAPLERDNPLSRLILATSTHLLTISRSSASRRLLRACCSLVHGSRLVPLTGELVNSVRLTRFEQEWSEVLNMARAAVRGMAPNPVTAGPLRSIALIFPMNDLFEALLRRRLTEALQPGDLTIGAREQGPRLLVAADGRPVLPVRPDFVFHREKVVVLIGDAKWKELTPTGRLHGLAPADVYQIAAYMERHGCTRSVLFFPRTEWMPSSWRDSFRFARSDARIMLCGVDVPAMVSSRKTERAATVNSLRESVVAAAGT